MKEILKIQWNDKEMIRKKKKKNYMNRNLKQKKKKKGPLIFDRKTNRVSKQTSNTLFRFRCNFDLVLKNVTRKHYLICILNFFPFP